ELSGLAGDEISQTKRDLITGANHSDGMTAALDGHPIRRDTDARRPSQRLAKAVGGPDEEQEKEPGAETKNQVECRRAEQSDGEHDARRNAFRELTVEQLPQPVGNFERGQNPADLGARKSEPSSLHGRLQ